MQSLPIFFSVHNRSCVVVGGGDIALRKTTMLLKANAAVTIVAPDLSNGLQELLEANRIQHIQADFKPSQLSDAC